MITNLLSKTFFSRIRSGDYMKEKSTLPFYPTLSVYRATVTAKTADYTITVDDLAKPTIFNNTGASGTVVFTLPSVASSKYKVVRLHALAAQIMRFLPQTGEVVNYNGSAVASKYLQLAGVIGNYVEIFNNGTQWVVTHANGVVTKEA